MEGKEENTLPKSDSLSKKSTKSADEMQDKPKDDKDEVNDK